MYSFGLCMFVGSLWSSDIYISMIFMFIQSTSKVLIEYWARNLWVITYFLYLFSDIGRVKKRQFNQVF
jgi:hypothetical protein